MTEPELSFSVRRASPLDADDVLKVFKRSLYELCAKDYDAATLDLWSSHRTHEQMVQWIASAQDFFIVAERGVDVIGIGLFLRPNKIKLCYVLPECIGHGVGRILVTTMENYARSIGVSSLELASTVTAVEFYRRLGYTVRGEDLALEKIRFFIMERKL